jgi:hypothetical protein
MPVDAARRGTAMNFTISIEPVAGNGYVARGPAGLTGEGPTPEEALARLRAAADERPAGAGAAPPAVIRPPAGPHRLLRWAGSLPDDELTAAWERAVEASRDEADRDPERP